MSSASRDDWPALPRRRRSSLRWRFVVAITVLVAIELVALALVWGLSSRQRLEQEIEAHGRNFAALAVGPVCKAYETYYASGHSKFRQLIGDIRRLNPDLVRIEIYDTSGRVLFSTDDFEDPLFVPSREPGPVTSDPEVMVAVRGLQSVEFPAEGASGLFKVIEPHVEDWGRHRYSVAFYIGYESLGAASRQLTARLLWPTVGSLLLGVLLAFLLARQSLEPLEQLIAGARDIGRGRLDRRIEIDTEDEFEDLALTFNRMASRLSSTIVELEESNVALQQSNVELEELDRLKSDLLANVSHELRTPLTSVQGYAEAMAEGLLGELTAGQAEALEVSLRNLDRLQRMINDLLTYSRLESERLSMERAPVDIAELARATVEAVGSARSRAEDIALVVKDGSLMVDADGERLAQVLENLLTNAVKFTPPGRRIEVRLSGEVETVQVEVVDQGIGIDPEQQRRIFDRFYQVESSSTRRFGGIGLGLSIVKQILDAHGCGIEIESARGVGTTFRFRLPRPETEIGAEASFVRVLVVDPDTRFTRDLVEAFGARDWAARVVSSTEAARSVVSSERPDVVVLERLLSGGDGFDLLREWRGRSATADMPIVVVTNREDLATSERLGATVHLRKPAPPSAVVESIEAVLEPSGSAKLLLVSAVVDRRVRSLAQALRGCGFACRRPRSGSELRDWLGGGFVPELVVLDARSGGREGCTDYLPSIVYLSSVVAVPVSTLVLLADERSGVELLLRSSGASSLRLFDQPDELLEVARNMA